MIREIELPVATTGSVGELIERARAEAVSATPVVTEGPLPQSEAKIDMVEALHTESVKVEVATPSIDVVETPHTESVKVEVAPAPTFREEANYWFSRLNDIDARRTKLMADGLGWVFSKGGYVVEVFADGLIKVSRGAWNIRMKVMHGLHYAAAFSITMIVRTFGAVLRGARWVQDRIAAMFNVNARQFAEMVAGVACGAFIAIVITAGVLAIASNMAPALPPVSYAG